MSREARSILALYCGDEGCGTCERDLKVWRDTYTMLTQFPTSVLEDTSRYSRLVYSRTEFGEKTYLSPALCLEGDFK